MVTDECHYSGGAFTAVGNGAILAVGIDEKDFASVICDGDEIIIRLIGDTIVRFPITVSAMLQVAEKQERINCELMPGGMGIEWPELDEHLAIQELQFIWQASEAEEWIDRTEWIPL